MSALLEVAGLSKRFGGVQAVDEVSFDVGRGERLALIGANGAGKSTLFNMIGGQLGPDSGAVRLEGAAVTSLPPRRLARHGVGRTFQVAATFGSLTVRENVQMARLAHAGQARRLWRPAADQQRETADRLLQRVGLADQADRPCAELAYGDVKRLEFAIALAGEPKLLLMDEPTAGMAPAERGALMTLVSDTVAEAGASLLFTEHDMDVVFGHSDRIIVLERGRLIANGAPEAVRRDPVVQRAYLGEGTSA